MSTNWPSEKGDGSQIKLRLQKVNRARYFDQAVIQIRALILSGDIAVGERLPPIVELSEMLNIGRSTVREALRVLETERLIEVHHGSGTYILPRSEWTFTHNDAISWLKQRGDSIIQLLQVREWLEGLSISLVATNPTPELLQELEGILEEIAFLVNDAHTQGFEPNYARISELNTRFHLTISAHSGNQIVHEFLSEILPDFSDSNKAVLFTEPSLDQQTIEHEHMLKAIKARDPDSAVRLTRNHIKRVMKEIQDLRDNT